MAPAYMLSRSLDQPTHADSISPHTGVFVATTKVAKPHVAFCGHGIQGMCYLICFHSAMSGLGDCCWFH